MSIAVPTISVDLVTDLVNEWATLPQELSSRPWTGYPNDDSIFRQKLYKQWPQALPIPPDSEITSTTDHVYPLFLAESAEELSALFNQEFQTHQPQSITTVHNGRISRNWAVQHSQSVLPVAMLLSIMNQIDHQEFGLLGCCAAKDCGDVYVDSSQPKTKRFCSARCQTRERVREHRRRHDKTH